MDTSSNPMPSFPKKRCGVLGATGSVGQRFALLLADHPFFCLHAVGASPASAGKQYKDAVKWKQSKPLSTTSSQLMVKQCLPSEFLDCDLVFSGMDDSIAGEVEMAFVQAGIPIFSNAKNHRHNPLVPLVIPTLNLSHLDLIPKQRESLGLVDKRGAGRGMLVCNSNCSVVGVALPFFALDKAFGSNCVDAASVTTLQALSGGGYPGVPSMDVLDNVVPFISGEEGKIAKEARKILGSVVQAEDGALDLKMSNIKISATCTRVPVLDGHTACVSIRFAQRPPPSIEDVKSAFADYSSEALSIGCPSAPKRAIVVMEEEDRPQPRLDRETERGYSVSVGRVRKDESGVFDVLFVSLSHNTILGAAGASILNAEASILKGLL